MSASKSYDGKALTASGLYKRLGTITLLILILSLPERSIAQAKKDSLILNNGDIIVGELKSLDKGVLLMGTDYSDKDFAIEWSGVQKIFCVTRFLITLQNGTRVNGSFASVDSGKNILIEAKLNHTDSVSYRLYTTRDEIVFLKGLKSDFWSRSYASIDLGLNITKANNLRQLTSNFKMGYLADKWSIDIYYSDLRSMQDSIAQTRRVEGGISYRYYLPKDWYAGASVTFLSNTEQALKLRTTGKLGMYKFLVHTNKKYLSTGAGISFNDESYLNEKEPRNSMEAFLGYELNLFNIGDFSLFNNIYGYKSLSSDGRWRTDLKLDVKYEFFKDFYAKMNLTVNYDNRPAAVNKETDYVFGFNIGWEL